MTEQQQIDAELDANTRRAFQGLLWPLVGLLLYIGAWCVAQAAEYTRQGGTADYACCADANCATVITQRMREWSAKDDCEALTDADGVTRYVRQFPMRVYKSGTSPTPTCPPKPADETQTAQCPAGTTGSWQQTQSYGSVPPPQCWVASGFIPTSPPEGACTVPPPATLPAVTAISATTAPHPTLADRYNIALSWLTVAGATRYEIERCTGATCTNFAALDSTTNTAYTNTALPGGFSFRYRIRGMSATATGDWSAIRNQSTPTPTTPPPATGTALLEWTPPTENIDGSALTNLAGYVIRYGTVGIAGSSFSQSIDVRNPALTAYEVTGLAAGTWAFTVEAYSSLGRYSLPSNAVTKVVP